MSTDREAADGAMRYDHVGIVSCGRTLRHEHHLPHRFVFQASDDSPEQVEADCPGWIVADQRAGEERHAHT